MLKTIAQLCCYAISARISKSMSNPFKDKFPGSTAHAIQSEYANDLVRVLGVDSILAEKMAIDIMADFGRLESAEIKTIKVGRAKKADRMMDVKVSLEALKGVETERLYCFRLLQELRRVQVELGVNYGEVTLPENRHLAIVVMTDKLRGAEKPWENIYLKRQMERAEKGLANAREVVEA